jgi:hypothetical protein
VPRRLLAPLRPIAERHDRPTGVLPYAFGQQAFRAIEYPIQQACPGFPAFYAFLCRDMDGGKSIFQQFLAARRARDTSSTATQSIDCPVLRRLLQEFKSAASEYHRITVVNEEHSLFDDWVAKAAEEMEHAKQALLAHEQEHGC